MTLQNCSRDNQMIAGEVVVAAGFFDRLIGLLGKKSYPAGKALWLHDCRSIHTWFMRFSIDVVFVNKDLQVQAVYRNLRPWRMTRPQWSSKSAFELAAGQLDRVELKIGDQLHVGA